MPEWINARMLERFFVTAFAQGYTIFCRNELTNDRCFDLILRKSVNQDLSPVRAAGYYECAFTDRLVWINVKEFADFCNMVLNDDLSPIDPSSESSCLGDFIYTTPDPAFRCIVH